MMTRHDDACQGSFIIHVLVFWISGLSAASTALLVGCLASNAEAAQQAAPPVFVLQLLFAGVFLPTESIPCGLRWIQYARMEGARPQPMGAHHPRPTGPQPLTGAL